MLDILVNNAGGGFTPTVTDMAAKGQAAPIAENFTQVADVTRRCVPLLRSSHAAGGGAIVNITSVEGHRAGPGFAIYSAMKSGVRASPAPSPSSSPTGPHPPRRVAPDMIPTPGGAGLIEASAAMSTADSGPHAVARGGTRTTWRGPSCGCPGR